MNNAPPNQPGELDPASAIEGVRLHAESVRYALAANLGQAVIANSPDTLDRARDEIRLTRNILDTILEQVEAATPASAEPTEPDAPKAPKPKFAATDEEADWLLEIIYEFAVSDGQEPVSLRDIKEDEEAAEILAPETLARFDSKSFGEFRDMIINRLEANGLRAMWVKKGRSWVLAPFVDTELPESLPSLPTDEDTVDEEIVDAAAAPEHDERPASSLVSEYTIRTGATELVSRTDDAQEALEILLETKLFGLSHLAHRIAIGPDDLTESDTARVRRHVEQFFDISGQDRIGREQLIGNVAHAYGLTEEEATRALNNAYRIRQIGKEKIEGTNRMNFTLDPTIRRDRRGRGTSRTKSKGEKGEDAYTTDRIVEVAERLLDVLTGTGRHWHQPMTPDEVVALAGLPASQIPITADDIKKVTARISGFVEKGARKLAGKKSPKSKSRSMEVTKMWLTSQAVKDAWKNDREGMLAAIREANQDQPVE